MPIYEWKCSAGHVHEGFSSAARMDDPRPCKSCGAATERLFPRSHCPPSGVYSYEPNIGDANVFEQRREAMKAGVKVMPKVRSEADIRRARDEGLL